MTEFKANGSRSCINEYIKRNIFGEKGSRKSLMITFIICAAILAVFGVVTTIITGQYIMLAITAVALLMGVAYPVILHFVLKNIGNKIMRSFEGDNETIAGVSENDIILIRNGLPVGVLEWSDIAEITEGETGFFLSTKENALLLLGKDAVVSGTYDEAVQVLRAKAAK